MTMKASALALALLAAPSMALAQSSPMQGMDMKGATSPATQDYMRAMQGMNEKMQGMKPANDPSMDFVMMMKPHHQAAVEMAQAYLKYGTDPKLKRMAQDVVSNQKKEIKEMTAWEKRHGM
ncbi:hypothetical protein GCM10007036_14920 [Alsobacter metallidurans]|uniref:DUF305 domain-containing protein n=1 Tax=Alsobacter metallidurans TaxID=340221 RepID=A0A917MJ38_9HYPH|nr:DUF305 domain-containing protein [Alsobacter metallidurans]GGH15134.1 hypothetical protein GCM10007036_14920 [Alsobacter metallidurans]